jgi:hypothetical protein
MGAAGTNLFLFLEIVDHFYPGKILRQRFALRLAAGVLRDDQSLGFSRLFREGFGFVEKFQLARFRLRRALLALASEELLLEKANPLLQKLDSGTVFCVQINEETLESFGRIGKCGRVQHADDTLPQNHTFVYDFIQ